MARQDQTQQRSARRRPRASFRLALALLTLVLLVSGPAHAVGASQAIFTCDLPIINYNNLGRLSYSAASDLFAINASPLFLTLPASSTVGIGPPPSPPAVTLRAVIDASGSLVGGVSGDDVVVTGTATVGSTTYAGVLLRGEVIAYASQDSGGTTDFHWFVCDTTGGELATEYGATFGVAIRGEDSTFTGDFTVDFRGNAKGDICRPIFNTAALGDLVWIDTNSNGKQDAGEPGQSGVTVRLLDNTGAVLQTKTTISTGRYLFVSLSAGTYEVEFVLPPGYSFTKQNQPPDDAIDSDADPNPGPTLGRTGPIVLPAGAVDLTWDAGLIPEEPQDARIGDRLWIDANANGIQDTGEQGYDGATVELFRSDNTLVGSTTTSGGGIYGFTVPPGDYYVRFTLPAGFVFTIRDVNANADDAVDSDADTTTGRTIVTTLSAGETDLTWDAGIYQPAEIGDFVWDDLNANGRQAGNEPGINGVTVNLYDGSGSFVATQTTSGGGMYLFSGLTPGDYSVEFVALSGYQFSPAHAGVDDIGDSDANPTTGRTPVTTLGSGESDRTWDAGLYQLAAIGDRVWQDANANGIQDAGEPGIDGVTVNLYDGTSTLVATQATAGGGMYLFSGLTPGDFFVEFFPPPGSGFSPQDQGLDDSVDSDADTTTGRTVSTFLSSGETDRTWDAGIVTIEEPIPAIDIEKATNGQDADGPTGPVILVGGAVEWTYVVTNIGSVTLINIAVTDDVLGAIGTIASLAPGQSATLTASGSAQLGQYENAATAEGQDDKGTKVRDTDPSHYLGVEPEIDIEKSTNGEDADGPTGPVLLVGSQVIWRYVVTNTGPVTLTDVIVTDDVLGTIGTIPSLDSGDSATLQAPPGTAQLGQYANVGTATGTFADEFGNSATVSDTDPSHYFGEGEPPSCEIVKTVKKLCPPCGKCEGKVNWLRLQYNGDEAATIKVIQKKGGNVVFDDEVAAGGQFEFSGQDKHGTLGTEIKVYVDGALNAKIHTSCSQPIGPGMVFGDFLVVAGTSLKGGPLCPDDTPPPSDCAECDGKVNWLKLRYEGGLADAHIQVFQKKNKVAVFDDTVQPGGVFDFSGSDKKGTLGTEISVVVNGELNTKIHTSCSQPIGPDLVFGDFTIIEGTSRNGGKLPPNGNPDDCQPCETAECDQEDGDGGNGELCDADDVRVGDTLVFTLTITANSPTARVVEVRDYLDSALQFLEADNGGTYVAAGHYVTWSVPLDAGLNEVQLNLKVKVAALPNGDNGPCPPGWITSNLVELEVSPAGGGEPATLTNVACLDCEGQPLGAIGDFVWHDTNRNGIQDAGEPGIENVVVELYDGATKIADTTTNGAGFYQFTDLPAATYTVKIADSNFAAGGTLNGWDASPADRGTDDAVDSDGGEATHTATVTLAAGEHNPTIDFGFFRRPTDEGCTRTIGYWKTHPDKWPLRRIKLGGVWFSKRSALRILWASPRGRASLILARQLIAVKLNIAAGADPTAITVTIRQADDWLRAHPVGTRVSGPSREVGIELARILDDYNNGDIGPGECEGQGSF